jgi:hypothetical protein
MKKGLLIFALVFTTVAVWAQENSFTLSGGYVFSNLEETDSGANGYRFNATYEFNPNQGIFSHGFTIGYIHTSASGLQNAEYKLNNVPIYYAPKATFGKGKAKVFVKGALGTHVSFYKREGGAGDLKTNDMGFYGGAAAGFIFNLNEKVFLNAEYEWAYLSNSWYRDGFVNTAMAGIGFKF